MYFFALIPLGQHGDGNGLGTLSSSVLGLGASRLVAVCRLVVALKIGDTVEVPEQLVEVKS